MPDHLDEAWALSPAASDIRRALAQLAAPGLEPGGGSLDRLTTLVVSHDMNDTVRALRAMVDDNCQRFLDDARNGRRGGHDLFLDMMRTFPDRAWSHHVAQQMPWAQWEVWTVGITRLVLDLVVLCDGTVQAWAKIIRAAVNDRVNLVHGPAFRGLHRSMLAPAPRVSSGRLIVAGTARARRPALV